MLKCNSHSRRRTEFPPRAGIQSARRPQLNERQEVPPTRLPGRGPRSDAAARRAATCAGTRRPCRSAPDVPGWPEKHQHAGVPARRSLRAVRTPRPRTTSGSTAAAPGAAPSSTRARSAPRSIQAADSSACSRSPNGSVPKNTRNACSFFAPRTTVERETTTPRNNDARKAFDDLFKCLNVVLRPGI